MPGFILKHLLPAATIVGVTIVAITQQPLQQATDAVVDSESSSFDAASIIREWQDSTILVEGQYTKRLVAVGDLHSDYENALKVLHMAGVVDEVGNWTGRVDTFVQTGDIIDRGDDTIKLFTWMEKLRTQATSAGGEVVSHLGNHEWMNLLGDWRYVYQSEIKTFGSVPARQKMLQTGRIGRAWATNYSVASRVPLHPSLGRTNLDYEHLSQKSNTDGGARQLPLTAQPLNPLSHAALSFVHGGLSPSYAHLTPYPSRINTLASRFLHRLQSRPMPPPHPPAPYAGLPHDAPEDEKSLLGENGPVWYRGWAWGPDERVCKEVDGVLQWIGVRRLIMGHTPNFHNIVSRCNGKIIIIDTGISHAYGGALSALSIKYTLTPLTRDKQRWKERELILALYPDRQEVILASEREIEGSF